MDSVFKIHINPLDLQINAFCDCQAFQKLSHCFFFQKAWKKKGNELLLFVVPRCALKRPNKLPLSGTALHCLKAVSLVRASLYNLVTSLVDANICFVLVGFTHLFWKKNSVHCCDDSQIGDAVRGNSK